MAIKVGINGFGKIGRCLLRTGLGRQDIDFVAVNDLSDARTLAHLLKYDSLFGTLEEDVKFESNAIIVGDHEIQLLSGRDPEALDWTSSGVEIVVESTGQFTEAEAARKHIWGTVKKVIITAPGKARGRHRGSRGERWRLQSFKTFGHFKRFLHHKLPGAARCVFRAGLDVVPPNRCSFLLQRRKIVGEVLDAVSDGNFSFVSKRTFTVFVEALEDRPPRGHGARAVSADTWPKIENAGNVVVGEFPFMALGERG